MGAGTVAQQAKLPLGVLASCIRMSGSRLNFIQIQFLTNVDPGKQQLMAQSLGSCHPQGELHGVSPASHLELAQLQMSIFRE